MDQLAGTAYDVVAVDGVPVLDGTRPDLEFGADGRVSGRATINRLMGGYSVEGDALRFGALATTMMAGPPEQMEQEQRVLVALSRDLRLVPGEADGELRLVADDGEVLLRRREEPLDG